MKISTLAATACKRLLAFVTDIHSVKKQHITCEAKTNVYGTGLPVTVSTCTPANKPINNISNDAKQTDASFSFIPISRTTNHLNSIFMKSNLPSFKRLSLAFVFILTALLFTKPNYGQSVTFNASGTFTVPAGVTSIKMEAWGGGGAGGGCNSAFGTTFGSGGGGGAYNVNTITVSGGQSYAVTIGAGGAGASDANGASGAATTVTGAGGNVTANGGTGGARRGGAAGGGGTGFNNGGAGGVATSNGAGGGGAAGNNSPTGTGNGGAGSNTAAGAAGAGALPGGVGASAQTGNGNGNTGAVPGGGGGGGKSPFLSGNKSGGNGGAGRVVITYTCPTYTLSSSTTTSRCTAVSTSYTATSATSGLTYSWTRASVGGITPASGSGSGATATETLVNGTSSPINVTYVYTLNGGLCSNTQNVTVTVNPNAAIVSVTGGTSPLCIGGTTTVTANGVVLGGGTGAWSSSNTAAATVNSSGIVTAVGAGSSNITFTITGGCSGTKTASQSITVNPDASVASVTGTSPLCIGATDTYIANSVVLGGNGIGTWSSSDNSVATVDATTGKVTAQSAGTANIIFTITGGCNTTPSAQQSLTVLPDASLTSVSGTTPLCIGATDTYSTTGEVLGGGTGVWSSDNTTVATVDPTTGKVTAQSAGTANIIFTITGGCNVDPVQQQQALTVLPDAALTSVTGTTPLCIGATDTYTTTGEVLGGGTGLWSSDNTTVATVDPSTGKVTAQSAGTANIIFTITGGCNADPVQQQQAITVNPDAAITSVTGGTTPLCIGDATTVTANGVVLGGGSAAWSSSDNSVATVDASGNVTAIGAGTANIIYTITGCNGTPSAFQAITVNPDAAITSVTGGTTPLCIGDATTVTANGVVLGGGSAAWSSSDNSVATVDASGNVTAVGAGTADIIYTITGCNGTPSAFQTITVNPNAAITSVTGGTTPLCIGDATTVTANGVVLGGGTAAWSSSDNSVATVDASGNVTAVGAGTADIIYTITGCNGTPSAFQTITVNANSTISLSSAAGTDGQTVCIDNAITDITYAIGGGATGAVISGLPVFVSGTYSAGVFTISGTPNVAGTFNYTVTPTGPCINPPINGTITVNNNSTISLSSATGTDGQTLCINTAITGITYAIGGGGTGASITAGALPAGVTGVYSAGVFTISGTPTVSGTFNYTVTTNGPCINPSLSGTITVNANSTISLSSASGTDGQTVCINNAIAGITYAIGGGGTGASITAGALPAGVTGSYSAGVFAISGTPTVSGTFNYTVTTAGPCINVSLSGTMTVNANSTISLSSATGTDGQTLCINTAITGITYAIGGGGTGASITAGALPAGVTGVYSAGVFTISGTPTVSGTFNYTVTTTGPCINPSLSGTITVNANSTISLSSAIGTNGQTVCINNAITGITYAIGGGGTGASITAGVLPAGVTGSYSAGVFIITGTPNESGTFNYTVTTTGPCINTSLSGTITVNPLPVVNLLSNAAYCNNTPGAAISFSSSTTGGTITYSWSSNANVGFGTGGTGNISAYTATNTSNTVVTATITVIPHYTNNTVTCDGVPTTFTITVSPSPVVNAVSNLTYCANMPGTIAFSSPTTGGTVNYSWTSSVNVGFGLNGNGNIGAFIATNNSFNPLIATVIVTPSLNGCAGSPVTFTVTVNPNANAGTISGFSTLCPGLTAQLSTNGSAGGTWTSSTPSIASVNPATGLVTANAAGVATIFYTVTNICGASTSSFNVTVNATASAGTISGPTAVCVGSSILLSTNGTSGGTWLSASPFATVNSFGLVTGVSAGTATIYYFISNSCGSSFTSYNVSVSLGANAGTITGSSSMCPGTVTQLFTTGTSGGTWSSSNPAVAIVDANGFVLGLNAGTTTISYAVAGNSCSAGSSVANFTLTVNPAGNAGTISGPTNVCIGSSVLLSTNGSSGGTWISASPSATVNSFGLVTGVSSGSATIYYFVANTCGSSFATYNINVSPSANAGTISGPSSVCTGSTINLSSSGNTGGTWSTNNAAVAIVDVNGVVLGTGTGTATITYTVTSACANSSTSTNITVNAVANAGTVSGASSVCAGLSTTFTKTGSAGGTWSSSNTAAASVNSTSGVVTGVAAGNSIITYTVTTLCGTATASAPVTVNPVLNAGTISGGSSVCIGSTINLSSTGNSGGSWSSSAIGIATVDATTGVVTSVTPGNTTITYTVSNGCGTSTATQLVSVNAVANAGSISGASSVCSGLSTTFTTNGISGGTWSSSNAAAASVNSTTGVVTGVAAGASTITYAVTTGCGTASASASITVNPLPSAGTITGLSAVCVGSTINLSSNIAGGIWSSNAGAIATVNPSGIVTGMVSGSATITYTVTTGCGTNVASFTVTVNPVPNAGTIDGPTSVCTGSSIFLTNMGGDLGGIWKSSNTSRATVDPATGEVTGVSAGNTIITYSVTNSCGSSTAGMVVAVNSLPNAGTISGLSAVCVGAGINLSASGDPGGTWTSTNTLVATVNATTGVVTGVAQGSASMIYTVGSIAVCGTASATHLVTVNPLANAGILSGASSVCAGLSTTFTSNGSTGGTWSSSNPSVASVNSTSGVVIGVAAGNATISYTVTTPTCGSATASATITVNPLPNAGTLSGASTVCVGSTIILSSNSSGGTWSSSTTSVATIGLNTGIVTGVAVGNATMTYTVITSCGTASTTYTISVNPLPNAGTINGTTFLCTGSTTTLSSSGTGGGTWSSSNNSAATVNAANGVVTGVSAGTSTIIYTVTSPCGTVSASVIVTVGNAPNGGTVTGASALCQGSTAIFTSNGTGGGSWSSNNTAAATVNSITGEVTGIAAGSASITYTVSGTCGSAASSANITISALPNAGSVTGAATLCAGSVTTFTSNGAGGGSWSSNNNLVATVNSTTGVVTGVAAGSATITYTVTNICGIATATADITINALPFSGTVSGAATLCAGSTTGFSSTGDGSGTWSSNNSAAATVDPITGVVTGVAAGSATISYTITSATCGSSVASANITINPLPNAGAISGSSTVCVGATTPYTSSGMINGSWSSANTAIATVNAVTGVVTGVAGGPTTITYTIINGCGTATATQVITVIPIPNAGTVSGASTVCVSSTTAYTSNGLSGGAWSSSNTAAATIDAGTGLITGVSPGNATITYTVTNLCGTSSASADITVIILPNAGTVSGSATVCVGSTTPYTSDGLSGGAWSSVTPSVATVDATTGVVTGVSAGNATITYTFTNGCGIAEATKMIIVDPLANAGTVSGAATVCIGSVATFTSSGLSGGTWSSSDDNVASVGSTSGIVTGVAAGSVTITYTSNTPCGTATASANITVNPILNAGTVSGNSTVCVGLTTPYTSSGSIGGTWSSVTPSVATVDATTGVVTGVAPGNATITYTVNGCGTSSASKMITVDPLPNAGIVSGAATVCEGSQATFSSTGLSGGTWSSSDDNIASVGSTSGIVIGVAAGSATITYTSNTPCGTATASANITVIPVLSAGTVSGASTLCIGSTTPYTSSGSIGGSWSSITPSVATVNATTGVVTGVSTGNATITYTVSNGCGTYSATKLIAVSVAGNPGTISGSSSVCTGSSVTFTRSGGVSGGSWSSSNTSIATVSGTGVVTGVGAGTAVISYSVTVACGTTSATKSITVTQSATLSATNITVSTDLNACSALVTLGSNVTVTGSPTLQYRIGFFWFSYPISSTHTFYRGTTPVTVIATNSCGTVARLFFVTVVDNQAPTITCKPDATRPPNGSTSKYSVHGKEFDATASDGCGVSSLIYSLSGATTAAFNNSNRSVNNVKLNLGATIITWKATDVNGNVSTCNTVVTVTNTTTTTTKTQNMASNPKLAAIDSQPFTVKVAPNPTSYYFTLQFKSVSYEKIKITVIDVSGRVREQRTDVPANSTLQLGNKYQPGIYIAEIMQGKEKIVLRLIKEGK